MTWVPPYFGSYDRLVKEILHNPFLGSPHPHPHMTHVEAEMERTGVAIPPDPCRAAAGYIVEQLSLLNLASNLPSDQREQFISRVMRAIAEDIDDICGNHPRIWPRWPWPGPPPWALEIASNLNVIAHTMVEGSLQKDVIDTAARIVLKATGGEAAGAAAVARGNLAAKAT